MRYIECGDILLAKGANAKLFHGQLRVYASPEVYKIDDFCMVFNDEINFSDISDQAPAEVKVEQPSGSEKVLEIKEEEENKSSANDKIFDMLKRNNEKSSDTANSIKSRLGLQRKSSIKPPLYSNGRSLSPFNKNKIDMQPGPVFPTYNPSNSFQRVRMTNSAMNLHELERKPSLGSISNPNHRHAATSSPSMKRTYSPVKSPAEEQMPDMRASAKKVRIAHNTSSSTDLFRGKDLISYKRTNLKNVFHKRKHL